MLQGDEGELQFNLPFLVITQIEESCIKILGTVQKVTTQHII